MTLERVNQDGDWITREQSGGGGGLPGGWTQDGSDPANVDMNGGSLDCSAGGAQLHLGADAIYIRPSTPAAFIADGGDGATVALDAGGLDIYSEVPLSAGATRATHAANGFRSQAAATGDGQDGEVGMYAAEGVFSAPPAGQAAYVASQLHGATVALDANAMYLENLPVPTDPNHAATKDYVDGLNVAAVMQYGVAAAGVIGASTGFEKLTWSGTADGTILDLTDPLNPVMLVGGVFTFDLVLRHDSDVLATGAIDVRAVFPFAGGGTLQLPQFLNSDPAFGSSYRQLTFTRSLPVGATFYVEANNSDGARAQTITCDYGNVVRIR